MRRFLAGPAWPVYLHLVGFTVTMMATMAYALHTGSRMSARHTPLINAILEIKLQATTAHLWFEEVLSGDRHERIEDVWRHIESADWYAAAILDGGKNESWRFHPVDDPVIRDQTSKIRTKLAEFRSITSERWRTRQTSAAGTAIDQAYDRVFAEFIALANVAEARVKQHIAADIRLFRGLQYALMVATAGLAVLVGVVIFRYLAQRRRAEEELHRSEEQLRLIFENTPLAISVGTPRAPFARTNLACSEMLGRTTAELAGLSLAEVAHPEDVSVLEGRIASVASGESDRFQLDHRCIKSGGESLYVSTYGGLLPQASDGGPQLVMQILDQTERIQAEEEARQHREKLAHVVRLGTMGEMAAGIAHEINQPLTAIASYAQAGRRLLADGKNHRDQLGDAISQITEQAIRAAEVVRRLRAFVQKRKSVRVRCQLNEVVGEVTKLAEVDVQLHGVSLDLRLSEPLSEVVADRVQIQQVLLNLIRNGMESMRESPEKRLTIETCAHGDHQVQVSVSDRGVGIKRDQAESLFRPFFSTKDTGMGMGLAISHSIVNSHGGKIWYEENRDRGVTFHFTLPAMKGL